MEKGRGWSTTNILSMVGEKTVKKKDSHRNLV
jgi:hypothetical protein